MSQSLELMQGYVGSWRNRYRLPFGYVGRLSAMRLFKVTKGICGNILRPRHIVGHYKSLHRTRYGSVRHLRSRFSRLVAARHLKPATTYLSTRIAYAFCSSWYYFQVFRKGPSWENLGKYIGRRTWHLIRGHGQATTWQEAAGTMIIRRAFPLN